ncbi:MULTISPECIES: carboxymuconolactone decarboxylase family protein [Phaeobacter]|uniref:carboxymuconolactone decarboxylase family protein n=1 Tax=Phaeobacter TaxID=302485 RepID=UPI000160E5EC|nr:MULTISPECIES: carboxymuconolactone decarboxylase family protein [Phaeobacter]AFO88660.1 carboxymuconolactone decarboxylase-like protein [Phaeobacter inhibens 2.10]APX15729.1 carboxymuconolactone decarboxylase family protein [Phaeobacter inhibens]AUQ65427.1 carboxymuconolactone decarboxylase-like protein [Phaeobacter inhibens]AUR12758.1 carboxymuconolactone decarboxylase-like protein [Phaeobacter inhibens]AXT43395.1 carboxymuconolactone decarboxylase family protein [Phaeobacter inhibens]
MTQRLDYFSVAGDLFKPMLEQENLFKNSTLEFSVVELVKLRASQINGCAFCIHMHTHEMRAHGESEDRMHLLNAWRESPLYTPRERAALAWCEALTRVEATAAPDADYDAMADLFEPREQVLLTLLIGAINSWNRIAIGFRSAHPVSEDQTTGANAA